MFFSLVSQLPDFFALIYYSNFFVDVFVYNFFWGNLFVLIKKYLTYTRGGAV